MTAPSLAASRYCEDRATPMPVSVLFYCVHCHGSIQHVGVSIECFRDGSIARPSQGRVLHDAAWTDICAWRGRRRQQSGSSRGRGTCGRRSASPTSRTSCRRRSRQRCRGASQTSPRLRPGAHPCADLAGRLMRRSALLTREHASRRCGHSDSQRAKAEWWNDQSFRQCWPQVQGRRRGACQSAAAHLGAARAQG